MADQSVIESCIFCGVTLRESRLDLPDSRTKEHVYGRWYRDYVVNDKIKMFTATGDEPPVFHAQKNLDKFLNNAVCKQCNNGWMSLIETAVDPVIDKLTSGIDVSFLSAREVETLARWAAKTAIVLGYLTPISVIVPESVRRTLLPSSTMPPQLRFFYAHFNADTTLEGAYLQLRYGAELPVVGESAAPGSRFTLCVYNHCLTVDFPPMLAGLRYDLSESSSAQLWPSFEPAGTTLSIAGPVRISDALLAVCRKINVQFDLAALRV